MICIELQFTIDQNEHLLWDDKSGFEIGSQLAVCMTSRLP